MATVDLGPHPMELASKGSAKRPIGIHWLNRRKLILTNHREWIKLDICDTTHL